MQTFGAAAADYQQGRPDYPRESIDWVLADVAADGLVVDVGAGTGKLSQVIAATGRPVVAVDPDPKMLERIVGIETRQGSGEQLPFPDGAAAAITFGQAWHWVDPVRGSAEVGRVLQAGGVLGLIWNVRDESYDWVRELGKDIHGAADHALIAAEGPPVAAPFGTPERHETSWTRPMTPEDIEAMIRSRSYVIEAEPQVRERILGDVRDLLAGHPDTAGRELIEMPYVTRAFRYRRP